MRRHVLQTKFTVSMERISIRISESCNAISFLFCAIDNSKSGLAATY
jgi:hypothetical protein